jgi:putative acetyltransferase
MKVQRTIRAETSRDAPAIRWVHQLAFGDDSAGRLVDELRKEDLSVISLVAEQSGQIVGHALFSRIQGPMRTLQLAPVGVHPTVQRCGIGSELIRTGLEQATQRRWQAVFVLGDPVYYKRFGFSSRAANGYTSPYGGVGFMAQLLDKQAPTSGVLVYPPAWNEDIQEHQKKRPQ